MLSSFSSSKVGSLIDGNVETSGREHPVLNPHNCESISSLHLANADTCSRAVKIAHEAQLEWAARPPVERGSILHHACNLIEARADELSEIVAKEAGKAVAHARGETQAAILCGRFFAGEGQRLFGRTMPSGAMNKSAMTVRMPCGVAALIAAANTPAPNFAWKVFPALICGNSVVLKPSEDTPISADWMARALIEAGVPAGVMNVVQGLGAEVGPALTSDPLVDVVSFTGSTRVGQEIAETAGRQLKKVSLELGGKNAILVCDDADIDNAVTWAVASAFSNAGQRCASGSRMIVMEAVYDEFKAKFCKAASELKLGTDPDCDLGPVINERQLNNMLSALAEATNSGADILVGGKRATGANLGSGFYLEPTVIEGPGLNDPISQTELFGPIANLYSVASYAEGVAAVNNSVYGLTSCIHTNNWDRAWTFTQSISAGVSVVNGGTFGSEPHMPFGGVRASGNGTREPGTEALDVYTELKDIYLITRTDRL